MAFNTLTVPVFSPPPPSSVPSVSSVSAPSSSSSSPQAARRRMATAGTANNRRIRMWFFSFCCREVLGLFLMAVDTQTGFGIEEVQAMGVDHQLDRVASAGPGPWVQPGQKVRSAGLCGLLMSFHRLLADIGEQFDRPL